MSFLVLRTLPPPPSTSHRPMLVEISWMDLTAHRSEVKGEDLKCMCRLLWEVGRV